MTSRKTAGTKKCIYRVCGTYVIWWYYMVCIRHTFRVDLTDIVSIWNGFRSPDKKGRARRWYRRSLFCVKFSTLFNVLISALLSCFLQYHLSLNKSSFRLAPTTKNKYRRTSMVTEQVDSKLTSPMLLLPDIPFERRCPENCMLPTRPNSKKTAACRLIPHDIATSFFWILFITAEVENFIELSSLQAAWVWCSETCFFFFVLTSVVLIRPLTLLSCFLQYISPPLLCIDRNEVKTTNCVKDKHMVAE